MTPHLLTLPAEVRSRVYEYYIDGCIARLEVEPPKGRNREEGPLNKCASAIHICQTRGLPVSDNEETAVKHQEYKAEKIEEQVNDDTPAAPFSLEGATKDANKVSRDETYGNETTSSELSQSLSVSEEEESHTPCAGFSADGECLALLRTCNLTRTELWPIVSSKMALTILWNIQGPINIYDNPPPHLSTILCNNIKELEILAWSDTLEGNQIVAAFPNLRKVNLRLWVQDLENLLASYLGEMAGQWNRHAVETVAVRRIKDRLCTEWAQQQALIPTNKHGDAIDLILRAPYGIFDANCWSGRVKGWTLMAEAKSNQEGTCSVTVEYSEAFTHFDVFQEELFNSLSDGSNLIPDIPAWHNNGTHHLDWKLDYDHLNWL